MKKIRKIKSYRFIGDLIEIKFECYDSWCKEEHEIMIENGYQNDIVFKCAKCEMEQMIPSELIMKLHSNLIKDDFTAKEVIHAMKTFDKRRRNSGCDYPN